MTAPSLNVHIFPVPAVSVFISLALLLTLALVPVNAADAEIEAYRGDTVTIRGTSTAGDEMYLFMTGEGLDPNGVTLTDTGALASKGEFTIVDVNPDQTWDYRWDTSQVSREIDYGVYIIYASTEPADVSHLGGSGTYKTVEVWLKDPDAAARAGSGVSYTLNPERHVATQDRTLVFTTAPAPPQAASMVTTIVASPQVTTGVVTLLATPETTTPRAGVTEPVTLLGTFLGLAAGTALVWRRRGQK